MFIENTEQNFIKISFDAGKEEIFLADMLKIASSGSNGVIAQVVKVESPVQKSVYNTATAKILFTVLNSGRVAGWQGNIPGRDFKLSMLEPDEILAIANLQSLETSVVVGQMPFSPGKVANVAAEEFKKPSILVGDSESVKNEYVKYLAGELSEKVARVVIVDRDGDFTELENAIVLKAGVDVKLPLGLKGLESLYSRTLVNVSPETRAYIENIFGELEEYLLAEDAAYIPFESFLEAINAECEESGTTELSFLSNNVKKLYRKGIFADNRKEINKVFNSFMHKGVVVLDLSEIGAEWKEDFVEAIIDLNKDIFKRKFFLINTVNTEALAKKLLNQGYKSGITPIFSVYHKSEVIDHILPKIENIIALSALKKSKIALIEDFLPRLGTEEAIIYGKITNNVPLLINISIGEGVCPEIILDRAFVQGSQQPKMQESFEEVAEEPFEVESKEAERSSEELEEELEEEPGEYSEELTEESVIEELQEEISEEDYEEEQEIEITPEIQMHFESEEEFEKEDLYSEEKSEEYYVQDEETQVELEQFEEEGQEYIEEDGYVNAYEQQYVLQGSKESYLAGFGDTSGLSEEDKNMLLLLDEQSLGINTGGEYEKSGEEYEETGDGYDQIIELEEDDEFDYASSEEFQDESVLEYIDSGDSEEQQYQSQQEFSEDDINNFLDLEEEEEALEYEEEQQEEIYEEAEEEESEMPGPPTPVLPVYHTPVPTSEVVSSENEIMFKEGDTVKHKKYGVGEVKKIIGYSERRLCSIQFVEVGRRLLDPKLAELELVNKI